MKTEVVRVLATALTAALWAGASSASAAQCHLHKLFDLPVTLEGQTAVVSAKINGQDVRFEVDSGAYYSSVTPEAAKRLGLEYVGGLQSMEGVGGREHGGVANAKDFVFAGVPLKDIEFLVAGREFHPRTVGLLGENVLGLADVEFDLANGVMRFFRPDGCFGVDLAYWANHADNAVPIDAYVALTHPHITGRAMVNGHPIKVMFDTGFSVSMLSRAAAERAGVQMDGADVKPAGMVSGLGRGVVEAWTAPIASFKIGDEEIKNTRLVVGKLDGIDVDMFLGMDFFLSHRIFLARSQDKLYFTYNGGPVFRVDQPPAPAGGAADQAAADDAPRTADGWGRRGDALMSRREYDAALDAFTKAVELEPKAPGRYIDRARARLAAGRGALAMADLDHALELKPGDETALTLRGEIFLNNDDLVRAEADFAAAATAAPDDASLQLRIAQAYEWRGRYEPAISHYDAWIGAHPKDESLWQALNGRCWARAMLGRDLDKALADCDAAVGKAPSNSAVFDSRGLVRLRLGRFKEAIADYDMALELQPKLAWSLYGRGLAKKRLGRTAEGEADIQAAVALNPDLPKQAGKIGLVDAASPAPAAKPAA